METAVAARESFKESVEYERLASRLRTYLKKKGYTQGQFADRLGMDRTVVVKVLNQKVGVTIARADRFARATGFELWEFVSEKELPEIPHRKTTRKRRMVAHDVFVANLNTILESQGYGKTEFAEALGLQRPNLYRVLDGTEDIGIVRAARFASGLGYSLAALLNAESNFS